MTDPQTTDDLQALLPTFRENGYVILKDTLTPDEVTYFCEIYDRDRKEFGHPNCWHPFANQTRNCNALVTSPEFDRLLRHPKILPAIEFLMGGPVCFGEICLRHMGAYNGEPHQGFHRDKPHWEEHPLRMDYMQLMVYLTDVDEGTHCFSISPESVDDPILEVAENVERNGTVDLHDPQAPSHFSISLFHIPQRFASPNENGKQFKPITGTVRVLT